MIQDPIFTKLDLEPVLFKAAKTECWSVPFVVEAAEEYKRFLYLCKMNPNQCIVPSKVVDKIWHYHILDTEKYADDCQKFIGRFLHHFPYLGMRGDDDEAEWQKYGDETRATYESLFHTQPPAKVWGNALGKCEAHGPCGQASCNADQGPCGQPTCHHNNVNFHARPTLADL